MRKFLAAGIVGLFLVAVTAIPASAAIKGDYLEVRSADVYTGPCFANSEVGLVGDQAILAWKIKEGRWKGVSLEGLAVVAVVKASATLGDPYHSPYPARAVLIVDERATAPQRKALAEFARSTAGRLLEDVVRMDTAAISLEIGQGENHGRAKLVAGKLAHIETRSLCQDDHLCGNEFVYYPPLVGLAHAMPAYTLNEAFRGQGLGVMWERAHTRSAFIGTFAL